MSYRNKTYVAFDADNDIRWYRMMCAWKANQNIDFNFYDAHELNNLLPSSNEQTIKRKLRERMSNAKNFVLLIGNGTKNLHRFVRWEIEQAMRMDLPVLAVNLSGKRRRDNELVPPILRDELAIHIPFKMAVIKYSLDHWPSQHREHRRKGEDKPYYYPDSVYSELGV